MAITLTWSSAIGAINGNSIIGVLPPSSVATNDVVLAFGGKPGRASGGVGPLLQNYTTIFSTSTLAAGPNFGAWFKIMGATPDPSVLLWGSRNTNDGTAYGMYVFRGVSSVIFSTGTQSVKGNSTNPNGPSIITSAGSVMAVVLAGSQVADTSPGTVSNFSNQITAQGNDGLDITIAGATSLIAANQTIDPGAWGSWSTASWISATIGLQPAVLPTITSSVVSEITETTATGGGNVTADGGTPILQRGVAWNTGGSPTTADNFANTPGTTGFFQSSIAGLNAGTSYISAAFSFNAVGSVYGSDQAFSTDAPPPPTSDPCTSFIGTIYYGEIISGVGKPGI